MRPALVHEDEPLRLHRRGHHHPPGRPRKLVALGGDSPPFFLVGPMRAMARHTVERLTESPVTTSMYSQRSRRVTRGAHADRLRAASWPSRRASEEIWASSSEPEVLPARPC